MCAALPPFGRLPAAPLAMCGSMALGAGWQAEGEGQRHVGTRQLQRDGGQSGPHQQLLTRRLRQAAGRVGRRGVVVGSARVERSGAGRRLRCSVLHIQKLEIGHAQQPQYCPRVHTHQCAGSCSTSLPPCLAACFARCCGRSRGRHTLDQARLRRLDGRMRAAPVLGRTGALPSPAYAPPLLLQPPPAGT